MMLLSLLLLICTVQIAFDEIKDIVIDDSSSNTCVYTVTPPSSVKVTNHTKDSRVLKKFYVSGLLDPSGFCKAVKYLQAQATLSQALTLVNGTGEPLLDMQRMATLLEEVRDELRLQRQSNTVMSRE
jgi:hypothetical protein